tara:strand:- start:47 stop:283 length:237 start_codon:yes stop_codon:yes gene_type:complete
MNEKEEDEQMKKFNMVTKNQKTKYANEIEYREEMGACKGGLEAAYNIFMVNPSSYNFNILESKMMRYQNIMCNCYYGE